MAQQTDAMTDVRAASQDTPTPTDLDEDFVDSPDRSEWVVGEVEADEEHHLIVAFRDTEAPGLINKYDFDLSGGSSAQTNKAALTLGQNTDKTLTECVSEWVDERAEMYDAGFPFDLTE
jgi:hypothetical protein